MLKCPYFRKDEFDFKELVSSLDSQDLKAIANKLKMSYGMISQYASTEKEYADRKVPQKFIDAVNKHKEKRKGALQKVKAAIESNN